MCGEIPNGHYKIDVTVHLSTNQTDAIILLPRKFEWTREMWINELMIVGGPVGLLRIDFGGMQREQEVTNALGSGYSFVVDNAVVAHTVYDRPRIVTVDHRGQFSQIQVSIRNVTNNVLTIPTFTNATFLLSFIMKDVAWIQPEMVAIQDRLVPQSAAGQFSTRAPFF